MRAGTSATASPKTSVQEKNVESNSGEPESDIRKQPQEKRKNSSDGINNSSFSTHSKKTVIVERHASPPSSRFVPELVPESPKSVSSPKAKKSKRSTTSLPSPHVSPRPGGRSSPTVKFADEAENLEPVSKDDCSTHDEVDLDSDQNPITDEVSSPQVFSCM